MLQFKTTTSSTDTFVSQIEKFMSAFGDIDKNDDLQCGRAIHRLFRLSRIVVAAERKLILDDIINVISAMEFSMRMRLENMRSCTAYSEVVQYHETQWYEVAKFLERVACWRETL